MLHKALVMQEFSVVSKWHKLSQLSSAIRRCVMKTACEFATQVYVNNKSIKASLKTRPCPQQVLLNTRILSRLSFEYKIILEPSNGILPIPPLTFLFSISLVCATVLKSFEIYKLKAYKLSNMACY